MYHRDSHRACSRRLPILSVEVFASVPAEIPHHALVIAASRICPNAPALSCELLVLHRRHGTDAERAGDQERINFIASQLARLIYLTFVLDDEKHEGGPGGDSAG